MILSLTHVQRLQLSAMLGAQRGDLATIRALWALQDKLALSAEEEKALGLRRETVAGQESIMWDPAATIPPKEIELTHSEIARIRSALEAWTQYGSIDRRWLEPLLAAVADPSATSA